MQVTVLEHATALQPPLDLVAEQLAVAPPPVPVQLQFQVEPLEVTAVAEPALQRLVDGAVDEVVPCALPQTPGTATVCVPHVPLPSLSPLQQPVPAGGWPSAAQGGAQTLPSQPVPADKAVKLWPLGFEQSAQIPLH